MWLNESNRDKHFFYAIPLSFFFTFLFACGVGVGMEIKDKMYGNKFDILDLLATILGATVGLLLKIGIISLLYSL